MIKRDLFTVYLKSASMTDLKSVTSALRFLRFYCQTLSNFLTFDT